MHVTPSRHAQSVAFFRGRRRTGNKSFEFMCVTLKLRTDHSSFHHLLHKDTNFLPRISVSLLIFFFTLKLTLRGICFEKGITHRIFYYPVYMFTQRDHNIRFLWIHSFRQFGNVINIKVIRQSTDIPSTLMTYLNKTAKYS